MYEVDTSMNCQSPTLKDSYLQDPRNGADLILTDPSKCSAALKKTEEGNKVYYTIQVLVRMFCPFLGDELQLTQI